MNSGQVDHLTFVGNSMSHSRIIVPLMGIGKNGLRFYQQNCRKQ
jgi:hypothetical protein